MNIIYCDVIILQYTVLYFNYLGVHVVYTFYFKSSSAILMALIFQMNFQISFLTSSKKLPLILFWNYIKFLCKVEVNLDFYDTEFINQEYNIVSLRKVFLDALKFQFFSL